MKRSVLWNFRSRYKLSLLTSVVMTLFLMFVISINDPASVTSEKTVIVVLGGGLTENGEIPHHTQLRLDRAVELFRSLNEQAVIVTLSGGTPHKPNPTDSHGFPIWESAAAARQLVKMGMPPSRVYEENFSLDTIGNAYFLRTVHCEPGRFKKLVVVTNSWHMDRTKAIFDFVFKLPLFEEGTHWSYYFGGFFLDFLGFGATHWEYSLDYETVGAGLNDQKVLQLREEREYSSLQQFKKTLVPSIRSLAQLHQWLFTSHGAYNSERHLLKPSVGSENIDPAILKTY